MNLRIIKIKEQVLDLYKKELLKPEKDWPFDIREGLLCINKHLFNIGYSVSTMKDRCNITDTNYSSRFCNYVGMTPGKYITHHRIQAARKLISNKKLKNVRMSSIGFVVGYEKPSSFTMTFKRKTGGLPPKKWKNGQLLS